MQKYFTQFHVPNNQNNEIYINIKLSLCTPLKACEGMEVYLHTSSLHDGMRTALLPGRLIPGKEPQVFTQQEIG